jgi:hypothetical protein
MSMWHVYYVNKCERQRKRLPQDVSALTIDSALSLARARYGHDVCVWDPHDEDCSCLKPPNPWLNKPRYL